MGWGVLEPPVLTHQDLTPLSSPHRPASGSLPRLPPEVAVSTAGWVPDGEEAPSFSQSAFVRNPLRTKRCAKH